MTLTPLADCIVGRVYRLHCRNLIGGIYVGGGAFRGIREKLGSRYLFDEYHYDNGPPLGTVRGAELIEAQLPQGVSLDIHLSGTICAHCRQPVRWAGPPAPAPWVHDGVDCGHRLTAGGYPVGDHLAVTRDYNQPLHDFLESLEAQFDEPGPAAR